MNTNHLRTDMVLPEGFVWNLPEGRCPTWLFVIFKCPATVEVDGKRIDFEIGEGILFAPKEAQKYYARQGKFAHDFVHFKFESEAEEKEFADIPHRERIHLSHPEAMSELLRIVYEEKISASEDPRLVHSLLHSFLLMVLKDTREHSLPRYHEVLIRLRSAIFRSPEKDWDIAAMAKATNLSKSHLQMLFKQQFGITCTDAVIAARLEMAKSLLLETQMPVAEIGALCGYNNTEHFIRQFKSRLGLTPLKYRAESRSL